MSIAESQSLTEHPSDDYLEPVIRAEASLGGSLYDPGDTAVVDPLLTAADVAEVVATAPSIGYAYHACRSAGWRAVIAGNRVTVNERVFAQYVGVGAAGQMSAAWMIHAVGDAAPIWITTSA